MKITTQAELEEAKQVVTEMKASATHPFVIGVFQKMLDELNSGGIENIYTPSFMSIEYFGYDIFKPLHRLDIYADNKRILR